MEFLNAIMYVVEVSGHNRVFSDSRFCLFFFTLVFPFYKMLFMNSLEFSCLADFFVGIMKTRVEYVFLKIRE
jgi:hypothetical protein